jgi:hypothetical protein
MKKLMVSERCHQRATPNEHIFDLRKIWPGAMAHSCNPSYSGESWFKASPDEVCETPISKNPSQKGLVEWLKMSALSSDSSTAHKHTHTHKICFIV